MTRSGQKSLTRSQQGQLPPWVCLATEVNKLYIYLDNEKNKIIKTKILLIFTYNCFG